jgi:hypothetical protein
MIQKRWVEGLEWIFFNSVWLVLYEVFIFFFILPVLDLLIIRVGFVGLIGSEAT